MKTEKSVQDRQETRAELLKHIEELRCLMVKTIKDKGLDHPKTIEVSQQLDCLLNKFESKV
ncbi:aspartyl-phosphate phosphatase Spo0E family protein [Radiobacillus deserti]|uniref:Aspartyl-phosphate phosphatase Spo0E family protein n=1 Tax=Radiobacillus deserti TaxID=2594883 RepID=A0A516KH97_9BACI|nr:aspartyl-phosphate phosphatase Spo0E family protein [Radiobacillus deserti]QDP40764.1 aspartyl-phosphate phosphatase Spo0E family protein [Radiobacillus deserti]